MNATNRALNRIVLFAVGVVLVGAGAGVAMAALWPAARKVWQHIMTSASGWLSAMDRTFRISEATTVSWFTVAVLAALLLIVVAAVIVIACLGGGASTAVIREEAADGPQGAVTIRDGFASDAITHSLSSKDEILSSRVSARRIRGANVLHVSVTPRQNTSPVYVAKTVTTLIDNLTTLTGRMTPTLISIRSGIRSKIAADQSRVE